MMVREDGAVGYKPLLICRLRDHGIRYDGII